MSRTTTSNYDTALALAQRKPVLIVEFGGVTRKYSSQTFADITANHKKFIVTMMNTLQQIDLLQNPLSRIGQSQFLIEDKGLDVTDKLKDNSMVGIDVTVKSGFQSLNDADFVTLPATRVKSVQLSSAKIGWNFITQDASRLLREKLFRNAANSNLNGALTSSDTTAVLDDASDFIDPTANPDYFLDSSSQEVAYALIAGREIVQYQTKTGTDLVTLGRGFMGTEAIPHDDNAEVIQFYAWTNEGRAWNLSDVILNLLMTTDDGSGHAYYDLAAFDDGYKRMGVGLSSSEVNIKDIERISHYYQQASGRFSTVPAGSFRPQNTVDWIEDKILKPHALYMFLDKDGKLTVSTFDRVYIEDINEEGQLIDGTSIPVDTIVSNDIIDGQLIQRDDLLINQIELGTDFQPITNKYESIITYKLDESVTDYNAIDKPFIIRSDVVGVQSANISDDLEAGFLTRWMYFWGNVPGQIQLKTKFSKWLLEPGDWIELTYDKFPEMTDATRGWTTKKCLITSQSIDWLSSPPICSFDLITWELYNRVGTPIALTVVESAAINDTDLAFNSTFDSTLQTEDAFDDLPASTTAQAFIVKVTLTPPGTSGEHWVKIGFKIQSTVPADVGTRMSGNEFTHYIHYDASESVAYDIQFMIVLRASVTWQRIKLDWFEASATGGSGDRPTLTFKQYKYLSLDKTISVV